MPQETGISLFHRVQGRACEFNFPGRPLCPARRGLTSTPWGGISDFEIRMLKPIDIYVLVALLALPASVGWSQHERTSAAGTIPWTQAHFAASLLLPQAAMTRSLQRLEAVGLVDRRERRVNRAGAEGLLIYGVPYLVPIRLGPPTRGVPTAHAAPPLKALVSGEVAYVWPDEAGGTLGTSLEPLHPAVPAAARAQPRLHELLALVDALRVGRVRERTLAAREIHMRLFEDS